MASGMPSVIDLDAELANLTMFRRTPHSTREDTKGSVARLASYRDGLLLALKSAGTDHWERHLTGDELVHVLDGSTTLEIVCDDGPPKSFTLGAGMIAVIPQGAWHRSRESRAPDIVDLNAEVAKLTTFQGRTPRSTMTDRQGTAARLASYRDGALTATKFAGKGHWEKHIADELIHILDGMATLDVAGEEGPQSLALRAGMMTVIPQGTWHRFRSAEGVTLMTATPFPSETIEDDLDDPRMVESKAT